LPVQSLLIRNIHTLVTMDPARREMRRAAMRIVGPAIEWIGDSDQAMSMQADVVLDLKDRHLVLPGLINTHHHFYQVLTRAIPGAQSDELFTWLTRLYPLWARMNPDCIRLSAQLAAAELLLSGCTTSSDHLYVFPNGSTLDDEIDAVREVGLRFHAARGSMSVGQSLGGLPPDSLVEAEDTILRDSQRLIERYHDNSRHAMVRMVLAPCSPFSVSPDLMRHSAALARRYPGVRLHTHLAESDSDLRFSRERYGMSPREYAESLEWLGPDVWHAHCVKLAPEDLRRFAQTATGVAHCPCSNMRLGSGIAPVRQMLAQGVNVGLGVDGSASNDVNNMLHETRVAMLLARVASCDPQAMTPRQALELATLGGARVLGRDDIGQLAVGMSADFIALDIDRPAFAGAHADPVAAVLLTQPGYVDFSFVNGRRLVDSGNLVNLDLRGLSAQVNAAALGLLPSGR
jgi:cytosine/adenosine deaminase-related metal-dependent hydrolase